MAHKQLVEICNQQVEIDLLKTNWLPICVNGVQWYVAEVSTFNNATSTESTPTKIYKQGGNGVIAATAPVGTIVEGQCLTKQTVSVPNCDGTTTPRLVDKLVGNYNLNFAPEEKMVYDVVNATIGGTISGTVSSTTLTLGFANVTILNDSIVGHFIDWGTGFTDIITPTGTSVQDWVNQPGGKYEVKVYAITGSGNIILLGGIELTWNGTTITVLSTLPATVNRTYRINAAVYYRKYCNGVPQGNAYTATNSNYTPIGTADFREQIIRDERFAIADVTVASNSTTQFEGFLGCEYATHVMSPNMSITSTGLALSTTAIQLNNNPPSNPATPAGYWNKMVIDWGDGEFEIVNSSNFGVVYTHTPPASLPSGTYEAIVYIQNAQGHWYVFNETNWIYNQATNAVTLSTSVSQGFTYYRSIRNLIQIHDEATNTITYKTDAGVVTTIGAGNAFALNCETPLVDTRITEPLLSNSQSLTEIVVAAALENASPNRITGAQAVNTTTVTNPTFTGARDVTVYNGKNVTIAFEYTTSINGTFHRINVPANSTWSNTLKRDDYTNEGTYVAGRVITAYAATLAAGEININWST